MASKPKTNTYPYAACRGGPRHRWDVVGPIPGRRRRATWGTEVVLRCDRCGTHRFDVRSRLTGDLLSRSYAHPEDYRTEWQPGATWTAQWLDELDNSLMLDIETEGERG
jgi:hypothetical protein